MEKPKVWLFSGSVGEQLVEIARPNRKNRAKLVAASGCCHLATSPDFWNNRQRRFTDSRKFRR